MREEPQMNADEHGLEGVRGNHVRLLRSQLQLSGLQRQLSGLQRRDGRGVLGGGEEREKPEYET